jgi:hypothetical protein
MRNADHVRFLPRLWLAGIVFAATSVANAKEKDTANPREAAEPAASRIVQKVGVSVHGDRVIVEKSLQISGSAVKRLEVSCKYQPGKGGPTDKFLSGRIVLEGKLLDDDEVRRSARRSRRKRTKRSTRRDRHAHRAPFSPRVATLRPDEVGDAAPL